MTHHNVPPTDRDVYVVRESDLPEVSWTSDGWTDGTRHGWEGTSETAMECVETHLEWARFYLAASRAIESEQAVDPVEAKARELAKAGGVDFDEQEPEGVEMLIGMARHVLGQEADMAEVQAKAWDEGYGEPRDCCGLCPTNGCPWDGTNDGPVNPYRQEAGQ